MESRSLLACALTSVVLVFGCADVAVAEVQMGVQGAAAPDMVAPGALRCFGGWGEGVGGSRTWVSALLSPRMVYSLLEWPRMQREAELWGFRVQSWRDPRVPEEEWRLAQTSKVFTTWDVPLPEPLPLDCLPFWAPVDHLPLVRVLRGTRLHPWPIWGVMTSDAWRESLEIRRRSLEGGITAKDFN